MWVPSQSFARLMLTLVQDSPRSTVLEKQAASKHVGAENDGVASHQSPGQNDPITLDKQPTSKDVGAENDGVASQQSLGENDPIASEEQPPCKDVGRFEFGGCRAAVLGGWSYHFFVGVFWFLIEF